MMDPSVRLTITTPDGDILDQFPVCHWRDQSGLSDDENDNAECVGSPASRALLCERIERYVREPAA